ncbi:hypothetical protein [Butyrivibrio sp. VCD2006]|uniref:hypothetical protein n=1 Tax=Butyrivibrio sp. VCD2006 TaxID=1280664 RepID=UPI0012DCAF4B|nr:hypothetical protein [Butyrivibrio sp. VCD2006]
MISVFFEFLTRGLIWIIKSIFDMIAFFLRQLFRLFRLFLVILPITGIVYSLLFISLTIEVIAGENVISSLLPITFDSTGVRGIIVDTLRDYLSVLSEYGGTLMYFILFMILLILAVPISIVFIGVGTFAYSGKYLLVIVLADLFFYLIGSVISRKTATDILKNRYRRLFPTVGRKLNQKSYDKWLQKHHEEFENDTFSHSRKRSVLEEFYSEDAVDDHYEDEYDEDYFEDQYEYEGDDYEDDSYEDDEYSDESDLYYDDYYEEPEDRHKNRQSSKNANPSPSFDFFAGCNSLESANRKYKSLVKLYHPDNMDGDTTALQEINMQYSEIKKRLG